MRGVHSAVDDIRRSVFTEVARLAYESDDYKQVDMIPYKIVPGEVAHHRHDVFLERAIVSARLKLALGMDLDPNGPSAPISANIQDAATDQKYFNEPLVNIIPYACNACPPKQVRITDSCQGCISHPCMNVCPKDAIYLDENKRCHIDQSKCIKCGKCFNQCPYRAISKVERPCAAACGMDAIESDELGRAKINYDKCVSCGMCLVNCPFAAIADKSQIFQLIQAIKRGEEVIACVAPAFVGQYGPDATPAKLKTAMRTLGFADVVEVAGAGRGHGEPAAQDALYRGYLVGEPLQVPELPLADQDLHALVVVQVHVDRGVDHALMVVLDVGELVAHGGDCVVVDHDDGADHPLVVVLPLGLGEGVADQVPDRLRPADIALLGDRFVELFEQLRFQRDTDARHSVHACPIGDGVLTSFIGVVCV